MYIIISPQVYFATLPAIGQLCFDINSSLLTNVICFRSKMDENVWHLTPRGHDWSQSLSALNMGFPDPTYIAVSDIMNS